MNILFNILGIISALFFIFFIIVVIRSRKNKKYIKKDCTNQELEKEPTQLSPENGRKITSLIWSLNEVLKYLKYANIEFLLSVVLIRCSPNNVLLCKLHDGPYKDYWGFPAGYVSLSNKKQNRNPKLKALELIKEYTEIKNLRLNYSEDLTCDKPLKVFYGDVFPVDVRVYEFILTTPIQYKIDNVKILSYKGIESIDMVNPLVVDIISHCKDHVFEKDFVNKIFQLKQKRPSTIESLEQLLDKAKNINPN